MKKILKLVGCLIALPILISTWICKEMLLIPTGIAALVSGEFSYFIHSLQTKFDKLKFVVSEVGKGNKVDITNETNIVSSSGKFLKFTDNYHFHLKNDKYKK